MASLSPFIRKTSPTMRNALAGAIGLLMPEGVNWADPGLGFAKSMIAAVDAQEDVGRAGSVSALERISSMADDVGDIAMQSVWDDQDERPELSGVQDRAIWLFINHPQVFQHAEDVRFIDSRRRTRRWDGFVIQDDLAVNQTDEDKASFIKSIQGQVSDGMVQVDIFERTRRGFDGTEYRVLQITVYAEQKLEVSLEFRDARITSIPRRPVLAAALTYEPQSGAVEVAANSKSVRDALVRGFVKTLLAIDTSVKTIQPRRFNLQHLKRPHAFPTDPEDRIEGVTLRSLRLMPLGGEDQRLTIELGRKSLRSIWDVAEAQFADKSPLRSGWLITSAVLAVTFRPAGNAKRGKTIAMQITEPNGCDLKEGTELEQLIGNKYLRRWRILEDEPELLEH